MSGLGSIVYGPRQDDGARAMPITLWSAPVPLYDRNITHVEPLGKMSGEGLFTEVGNGLAPGQITVWSVHGPEGVGAESTEVPYADQFAGGAWAGPGLLSDAAGPRGVVPFVQLRGVPPSHPQPM